MERELYKVTAEIVDANGTYNPLSGYPKVFDSKHYQNDVDKARSRAVGDWHEVMGAMAKIDSRQLQIAQVIQLSNGAILESGIYGKIADVAEG